MAEQSHAVLSRRGFLKGTGAAALGLAGAGSMASAGSWLKPAQAHAAGGEYVACTYHQSHCGNMCSLKCTVRDGRLVLVEPNDAAEDQRYQVMCLKGVAEVQHIYSDKRVQTPLKRVGERGENKFEQISWDDAIYEIAEKLKEVQGKYGKDSVMVAEAAESDSGYMAPMLGARGVGNKGIDVGYGNGYDPSTGEGWAYGMQGNEARDWVNSRMVLNIASNFCESSLTTARQMMEAMEAGTKFVVVDPHFCTTASKASEWIPIEVGTDAALFLGMISYVLDNDLFDEEFCKAHTSFPFLVDEKTGKLIRDHEPKEDPETGEPEDGKANPFMVVEEDGSIVPYTEAKNPKLKAVTTIDGNRASTVFFKLTKNQQPYSVKWASEMTGIPEAKIEELTREYAAGPSSLAFGWGGSDKMSNADIAGHACAVLVALTGNIGKPGASAGVFVGGNYNGHSASLGAWAAPEEYAAGEVDVDFSKMRDVPNKVKALITFGDTVSQRFANQSKTEEWVKGLELVVTADPYFTEGAKWSDYVLPLTTRFEYDEDYGNVKVGYNHICLQEKIVEPLFEAKTDLAFTRELAARMGASKAVPATARERVDAAFETSEDPYISALSVEKLHENQGIWPIEGIEEPRMIFQDRVFSTTSGNMELYYEDLVDYNQALPVWEPNLEATPDNPLRKQYPFQLSNARTRFRIHNQFNDAAWLHQYYRPTVAVNPKDLEPLGIKTGDLVRVFNDRGSVTLNVDANESIRPGSVRMYDLETDDYTSAIGGGGNLQSLTNDTLLERGDALMAGPVVPFSDTLVAIEKA